MVQIQFSTALVVVNIALMFMGIAIIMMFSGTKIMAKRSTSLVILICILLIDFVCIINIMPTNRLSVVNDDRSDRTEASNSNAATSSNADGGKDTGEMKGAVVRYYKDIGSIRIIRDRYESNQ